MVRQQRRRQRVEWDPLERQRLVARGEAPTAHDTLEAHGHVVPHIAVRIADHLQLGIGVHADEAPRHDRETGLLAHLARDGAGHGLADLHGAAGQTPLAAVRTLLQQEPPSAIEDDGGDAGTDPEGALVVTLERDHRTGHRRGPQGHAAVNSRWNCSHGTGGVAATPAFSSTWATAFMPTSAVPTPGVERTNWSARWASVARPGSTAPSSGGRPRASWLCIIEAEAIV